MKCVIFRPGTAAGFMPKHPNTARDLFAHEYRLKALTPRVRLATRLYNSGLCKTKAEAADKAGLSRSVFYIVSQTDPQVASLAEQVQRELEDETIDAARIVKRLGRKGLGIVAEIADNPLNKAEVRLKAAQDLADRSPETSKVINVNARVETPLSEDQVAALRRGMIEAAALRDKFAKAAEGSFVTVTDANTARSLDLVKERAPLALPPGGESSG